MVESQPTREIGRVFVGRQQEMAALRSALNDALSGRGQLVMLAGEPGIGKTRIAQELATYAKETGAQLLWGWCYEEGSLSLPYLPFVEALQDYVLSHGSKDLEQELGTGASDLARIVPGVRDKLQVEIRQPGDPEEDRYRLLQAVSSFLRNASSAQPLLLVLEDLHDADRGTLDLLTHIARNLEGSRLMLVGTYRDVEVDRTHPLSGALASLSRVSGFSRVLLRGLTVDEVQRMVEAAAGEEVQSRLAVAVERQTEGNPLFVQEVLRYLVEEGLVSRQEGTWLQIGDASVERVANRIPEGLRDVIGKRFSRLSEACNRLLAVASVIGREFPLALLQQVAQVSDEELDACLEEAQSAVVIEERSSMIGTVNYWFTHAFFRQTMYEEIIAPRRLRLHQQVARALEKHYHSRLEEHAAEPAEHFSHSSEALDLAKAIEYGEMAAQRATAVYAYGEGVGHLERCLQVQEVLDPGDSGRRCDLLLALGNALGLSGEPRRVVDVVAPEALSLAEDLGDSTRASRACGLAVIIIGRYGGTDGYRTSEAALWADRAYRYAQPDTVERAVADTVVGLQRFYSDRPEEGVAHVTKALELSRRLDDTETFWLAACNWLFLVTAPQHGDDALRLAEELSVRPRTGVSSPRLTLTCMFTGSTFLTWGQRGRAEEMWRELDELAQRGNPNGLIWSMLVMALLASMDGRLEDAVAAGQSITNYGNEQGIPGLAERLASFARLRPLLYLGKGNEALLQIGAGSIFHKACCLAHLGRHHEVTALLEELVLARPDFGSDEDETRTERDIMLLEAAVLVGHREAAALLLRRFAATGMRVPGYIHNTCIARHLGDAAALLGRPGEARGYY